VALPVAIGAYAAAGVFLALGVAWTVDTRNKERYAETLAAQLSLTGGASGCAPGQPPAPPSCAQLLSGLGARDTSARYRDAWYALSGISATAAVGATLWAWRASRQADGALQIKPGGVALHGSFR
jgi:hypothetical protein